jgi:hypothetical protein
VLSLLTFVYLASPASPSAIYTYYPAERLFLLSAANLNRLVHLDSMNDAGREMASLALVSIISISVMLFLRLIQRTALFRVVLDPVGGFAALALGPALWLYALQTTWIPDSTLYPFWKSFQFSFFIVEVPLICAVLFMMENRRIPLFGSLLTLLAHCFIWTAIMWRAVPRLTLWVPAIFFVIFPCSGIAWLFYARDYRRSSLSD